MGPSWIDAGMKLFDAVNWDEVKETAKFYYTDETTTLNLYPALIISILLLFLLVPILGAIPTIDLFPSTSGGYGYGAPEPSYGAPEPSYGAPSDGYGAPARNSWSSAGEYRSFNDEESDSLKDIYNSDWASQDATSAGGAAARSLESAVPASPLSSLVNKAIELIN